jgi:outer membrane protein
MPRLSELSASLLLAGGLALSGATAAQAQGMGGTAQNYVGVGAALTPDYAGSDETEIIPFAAIHWRLGDVLVETREPGVQVTFNPDDRLQYSAFARWRPGRETDDIEDPVVSLLSEVDGSVVAGFGLDYRLAQGVLTPRDRVTIGGRLGADALGEFSGVVWSANIGYGAALSERLFANVSLGVSGFPDEYAENLFSIDAADAAASGLTVFDAEDGVRDIGLTFVADYRFSENWSVTVVTSYSRLLGDFADSPITADRGDENQGFVGLAVGRRF